MSEENEIVFDPTKAIRKIAELRVLGDEHKKGVDGCQSDLEKTDQYKALVSAEDNWDAVEVDLGKAIVEFKAGCEAIFEETEEKIYPGGKIRLAKTFKYKAADAVNWAIEHKAHSVLRIAKGDFKNAVCRTPLCPDFVKEIITPKLYLDGDLSEFLNSGDDSLGEDK